MSKVLRNVMLIALCSAETVVAQSAALRRYTAIRDSLERRIPAGRSIAKIDWRRLYAVDSAARQRLAPLARAIVGPFAMPGLVQPDTFNVETFLPGEEDSHLADGMRYSSVDGKTRVFVSTPELIRLWRNGDPIKTLGSLEALNQVLPADAAITPYALIPVTKRRAVLAAVLVARQQDYWPSEQPDEILLSFVRGRQLVVVEAPAPVSIAVPSCGPNWLKPPSLLKPPPTVAESLFTYGFTQDAGYRTCYSRGVIGDPRWPRIIAKAEQLVASILGR